MGTPVFWVVIAALAIAQGLIVVSALRIRTAPDPARGRIGGRRMEAVWTLLPTLLLLAMAVLSLLALEEDTTADQPQATAAPVSLVSSDQTERLALMEWPQ